jgi:hypothetical protein
MMMKTTAARVALSDCRLLLEVETCCGNEQQQQRQRARLGKGPRQNLFVVQQHRQHREQPQQFRYSLAAAADSDY